MSRRVRGDDAAAGRCEREEAPGVREGDGRRPEGAALGDISGAITELVKSPCNQTKKVFKKF